MLYERLTKEQKGVALGMAAGLVISLLALAVTIYISHPFQPSFRRIDVFAISVLGPALALVFSIARIAAHRFFTPADINGSGLTPGTEQVKLLQSMLQNTLEQAVLALIVYAAGAVLMPDRLVMTLLTGAGLFLAGRMLFFWGYEQGAASRSLGFALTFYPTIALLTGDLIAASNTLSTAIPA